MTDEELQKAIEDAENNVKGLSSPPPSGPLPEQEVRRREMVLLRQLTLYKIVDAKRQNKKGLELLNTAIYGLMVAF
ncbi:MAG: hypothetical protein J7K77_02015 [Dehalococcoidales bacterium]|nr:hypothetical protein [Dehalococcoidales bacterium]